MTLAIAKGFQSIVAWKRNPNEWGCGGATAVGAGSGIEIDKEGLVINSQLIENVAVSGRATQLPGVKGTEFHAGPIGPMPFYYQGVEQMIAQVFGTAGTPTQQVNRVSAADGHITSAAAILSSATAVFVASDVGRRVTVPGAGAAGATLDTTIITFTDSTHVVLNVNAGTTVTTAIITLYDAVYLHVFKINDSVDSLAGTLVMTSAVENREYPFVKLGGVTLDFDPKNLGKLTFDAIPYNLNLLDPAGTQSAVNIVVAVTVANGALTIVGGSPITAPSLAPSNNVFYNFVAGSGAITEFLVAVLGVNADGDVVSEVYQFSVDGATKKGVIYFASIISATVSGLAGSVGTATIGLGWQNGVNNSTQVATITVPSTGREFVTFPQCQVMIKEIDDSSAWTPAQGCNLHDEVPVAKLSLKIDRMMGKDTVTTRTHRWSEDPVESNFIMVTGSIDFARWENTTQLNRAFWANISKKKKLMKIVFSGPVIVTANGNTAYYYKVTLYLNNVQFQTGSPNIAGPGVIPLNMTFKGARTLSVPTNFPVGYSEAVTMELTNQNSADALV